MDIWQNCRTDYEQRWKHQRNESSTNNVDNYSLNMLYPLEREYERRQMPKEISKIEQTDPKIKAKFYFS